MSALLSREDAGEILRQASAVVGRPVTLWEVTGAHQAIARATSSPDAGAALPGFDLDATLRRWKIAIPVGSLWVATPGGSEAWVVAPVRDRPSAPPPGGRERRSRERLALELAGLALGMMERAEAATAPAAVIPQEASNPLSAARAGLQLSMESIGRWVDLAADRRLALLDDLGQILEDIDRATEFLRAVQSRARDAAVGARPERFDAVRVVRSCLTLERRLLRDRGIELDFQTTVDASFLQGDPNALFDLLVNLVRSAADAAAQTPAGAASPIVEVRLARKGRDLEVIVRDRGRGRTNEAQRLARVRHVVEGAFAGTVRADARAGEGTTFIVSLPLPPQREAAVRV